MIRLLGCRMDGPLRKWGWVVVWARGRQVSSMENAIATSSACSVRSQLKAHWILGYSLSAFNNASFASA